MREILFRGKRNDGKWVYGGLIRIHGAPCILEEITGDVAQDLWYWIPVVPETVGQYTGLTDAEGNKIFEGDIVRSIYTKRPYVVCFGEYTYTDDWGDEQTACGWYNIENGGYMTAFGSSCNWAVIIGNIHDNPELL